MDTVISKNFKSDTRKRYNDKQTAEAFSRKVEDTYETVAYLSGSSMRLWYNTEPTDYSTHWHPAIEIIMPLENGYRVECNYETFDLSPGDIFLIPSGALHTLYAPPTGSRLIFLFDFEPLTRIKGFSYVLPYITQPVHITMDNCPTIYRDQESILEKIFTEYAGGASLWELKIYSYLLEFFVNYGRYRFMFEENPAGKIMRQKDMVSRLNMVFDFIDEHYMEDITLERAADEAGFSKFHFSRIFKQGTGQNFYDYLCYKRIQATESLLLNRDMSITEIALQCGFSSLSTFNRTFKREKGCTPSQYRMLLNKNNSQKPEVRQ